MISQILFILILGGGFFFAFKQFRVLREKIFLGSSVDGGFLNTNERWKNVLLIALGQKKMFKRPAAAIFHLCIYVAFLFTQIELIEIITDGILGTHRIFAPYLGAAYNFLINWIEFLSILAFTATIIFLARRNLLKLPRFQMDEMSGWPKLDGNIILYLEILLIVGIFAMNAADVRLQEIYPDKYPDTGHLFLSTMFSNWWFEGISGESLMWIERAGWWLHFLVVLLFLNYLPQSKHLHIVLAFPNTWYNSLKNRGRMSNMPEIMNEVKSLMGLQSGDSEMPMSEEIPEFGAKDVKDLPWTNILAAYSCTECGRCSAVCPASVTGKKLSPRKIMMDVRDRTDEYYGELKQTDDTDSNKTLLGDYITSEEIHACTTCNACVEACPVLINPLDIILQLRRYEILTLSEGPKDWLPLFNSIESSGSAWQINKSRMDWINE